MKKRNYNFIISVVILMVVAFLSSCSSSGHQEKYIRFHNASWNRFRVLRFEIPVAEGAFNYNLSICIHTKSTCTLESLPFNMVLNTPSGEERIKEFLIPLKNKNGSSCGKCTNDSCIYILNLKKDLFCSKAGNFLIEVENLYPRPEAEDILTVGIILEKE